jgi:hypothetical protein
VGSLAIAACARIAAPAPDLPEGWQDVTAAVGVRAIHTNGATGRKWYPETFGAGVCVIDLDGDDRPDLLFLTGSPWDESPRRSGVALYRNRPDGTFADVTQSAGLAAPVYGMGCAVADYDNDGRDDVLLTGLGGVSLFHGLGNGRFSDATTTAGLTASGWSTCAVWFDADADGRLDLFVCRYVAWTPETDLDCRLDAQTKVFCGPDPYPASTSVFFRNRGDGTFAEATQTAGLVRPGKALGAALLDSDDDGKIDLFVANDQIPNALFRNRGDGTFEDHSARLSPMPGRFGMARAGMGVDVDDARGGIVIGHFTGEGFALYQRDTDGRWKDRTREAGLLAPSLPFLTFGMVMTDVDLDGWLDIVSANGHVDADLARSLEGGAPQRERPLLFRNRGDGTYLEAGAAMGLTTRFVGRGLIAADLDRDGDPDLVFTENNGPARVYRNHTAGRHWLGVRPIGKTSNRDGIGAVVSVRTGDRTQTRMVRTGSSYLSQSERTPLFGLGAASRVDELVVRWPSGVVDHLRDVPVDRRLTVTEGTHSGSSSHQ